MNREYVTRLFAIAVLSAALPVSAQTDVEKRLDDLERRVKALESTRPQTQRAPSDRRSGWRQLVTGMSPEQVRALLGEPDRIDGGGVEWWYWKDGGKVTFISRRVDSWSEPPR